MSCLQIKFKHLGSSLPTSKSNVKLPTISNTQIVSRPQYLIAFQQSHERKRKDEKNSGRNWGAAKCVEVYHWEVKIFFNVR